MWVQIDTETLNYLRDCGNGRVPFKTMAKENPNRFSKLLSLKILIPLMSQT